MKTHITRLFLAVIIGGLALGCSDKSSNPAGTTPSGPDSVTGIIERIEDTTPVDGGVIIELKVSFGQTDTAYMPSLFTEPPPPPEQFEIYRQIRQLEIGDMISVRGERDDYGIEISELTVLLD